MKTRIRVCQDGTYVKPASNKLAYGTMVFVRVGICYDSLRHLMRAVTIATRYAAVRHQSKIDSRESEPQILEYQTQQYKVLPQIATVFALMFSANTVRNTYYTVQDNLKDGNLNLLPELHALSCGLKALCTTDATSGIEILRLSCGGHGYLASSNLPRIFVWATAAQTYEGENTVLWLQVARYLMKCYREVSRGGQLQPSVVYLAEDNHTIIPTRDLTNEGLVQRLKRSVFRMVQSSAAELESRQIAGERYERAWNASSIGLVKCAQAHIRYFVCKQFVKSVGIYEGSEPVKQLLEQLCRLYLLYTITKNQGILLRAGSLSNGELNKLEGELGELLAELRLDAVNIVDAFDCHDAVLNSTLGSWDGDVYNRLYRAAMESPLNKSDVTDGYQKYMKAHLKSNL
ncbi:unnamed protein product [Meganyctiphanes norvegica]|uniref:Peroxisomal acyl-coenzyme A oxidase 1 n=1 Tax=Meganyctiphanes norvegica TaxID=48144 RepID=A0AAV2QJX0_MEGNR